MRARNNKAFTFVELMAIIVIVALLALIATPVVSNVVAEGRKNSFGVTCQNIYNAIERFVEFQTDQSCFIFDFEKDITSTEVVDGVTYQPISKLQLNGTLPRKGQAKYCDGTIYLYADDGENTCLVNEETKNVVTGTLENVDITAPVLRNLTLTSTSSTIRVIVDAVDEDGEIKKFYYSLDGIDYIESEHANYTFEKLKSNKEYKVYVKVENASGLYSQKMTKLIATKDITKNTPKIAEDKTKIDENFIYAIKRTIDIEYNTENLATAIRYFKSTVPAKVEGGTVVSVCGNTVLPGECIETTVEYLKPDEWYKTTKDKATLEYTEAGTLYAIISDGTNLSGTATHTISDIDITEPVLSAEIKDIKTDRLTLHATCTDGESGIYKYEFSKDAGKTWVDNGDKNIYTFYKLTQGTTYEYSVRCTNGTGILNSVYNASGDTPITIVPEISNISNTPDSGYSYFTKRIYKITYSPSGIVEPEYYFKANTSADVVEGTVVAECGNGVVPTTCTAGSVSTIVPNIWYKSSGTTINILFESNGTIYALTGDGTNISTTATHTVSDIDTTKPSVSLSTSKIKTDRITLTATCEDNESGITKYEFSKDGGKTWKNNGETNTYTYTKLQQNTEYSFAAKCTNGSALTNDVIQKATTATIVNPTIANSANTPSSGYEYYISRTYVINYDKTNVNSATYYFKVTSTATVAGDIVKGECGTAEKPGTCSSSSATKLAANTWYKTTNEAPSISFTANGKVYAITGDGTNFSNIPEVEIKNIDTSNPTLTLGEASISTNSITIPFTAADTESGIVKSGASCEYGVDETYGNKGTISGDSCVIRSLKHNATYYYKVTVTNGSSLTTSKTGSSKTFDIVVPTFTETTTPSSDYTWFTKKVIKITYSSKNITSAKYYFKSSVAAKVASGVVKEVCGTATNPGSCQATTVTELVANTWYSTESLTPEITYTANGTLYAITGDGTNISRASTHAITNIDITDPTLTLGSVTSNTDTITIPFTANDAESDIKTTKCEYGTSTNYGSTGKISGTKCVISGLKQGTTYYYKITTTNNSSLTATKTGSKATASITVPTISVPSTCTTSKTVTITYSGANIGTATYKYSTDGKTWTESSSTTQNVTYNKNGKIYARTYDATGNYKEKVENVTNVDVSDPEVVVGTVTSTTNSITIPFTASDSDCNGVVTTKCEYGTSTSYGKTGTITDTGCVINNLDDETTYYYKITATDTVGKTKTATGSKKTLNIVVPTFTNTSNTPSSGYTYYTSRVYKITYSGANITSPKYYFKSSVDAKVASGVVKDVCGTSVNPGACQTPTSSITEITANTWYRTDSLGPEITYTANGTIYAVTGDGTNISSNATHGVTNIDIDKVTVTLSSATAKTDSITIPFTVSVGSSGVKSTKCEYGTSTSYGKTGTISGTNCVISGLTQGTTYYYKITATNNASTTSSATGSKATATITAPTISIPSTCTISKNVTITYSSANITSPVYQYSTDGTTWKSASSTQTVTFTATGKIYARTKDATGNYKDATPQDVKNVDSHDPTLTLGTATTKTDSITVPFTAADSDCAGTVTTKCEYGTSTSYGKTGTVSGTNCVISGLTQGTKYYYKLTTTDTVGKSVTKTGSATTNTIVTPTFENTSNTPSSGYTYYTSRVYKITYSSSNITSPVHQYSFDGSTWTDLASGTTTVTLTRTVNGTIYARTKDGSSNSKSATQSVTNIDTTDPEITVNSKIIKTDNASLAYTATDNESGIKTTTCVYGTSTSYGKTATVSGSKCQISGLTQGTTYYYKLTTTNNAKLSATATGSFTTPVIEVVRFEESGDGCTTGWSKKKTIKVIFSSTNISTANYYFKSSVAATSSVGVYACDDTSGSTCGSTSATSLVAGKWYKTTSTSLNVTYTANGTIYGLTADGSNNTSTTATHTISNIDTSAPSISTALKNIKSDRITVTATCTDNESGIAKYEFSKDGGNTWLDNGTTNSYTFTGLTSNKEYTFAARCTNKACGTSTVSQAKGTPVPPIKPIFENTSNTPSSGTTYYTSRTYKITYSNSNVESPVHQYSFDGTNWTTLASGETTVTLTRTVNGTIYARTKDASSNFSEAATNTVTNIDTTQIKVTLGTATTKTNNITIPITITVGSSGVKTKTCEYGTSTSYGKTGTISGSNCVISGLTQGTTYYYKVTATNNAGGSHSATGSAKTATITAPTISVPSTCTTSKNVTITYSGTNITSPVYEYSTDGSTWKSASSTQTVTFTATGKIYARTSDGTNTKTAASNPTNVTNVDSHDPTLTLGTATTKTDSITVPFTAADSDCAGTVTTTCVYGTSTSYGKTGTVSGTNCVISGLTQGTKYYYKLTTTDTVGKSVTKTGSATTNTIVTPTFTNTSNTPSSGYTYYTSRVYKITYSSLNITSPVHQYSFDGSTWTNLASGTTTVTLTREANGTIYARTLDGSTNSKAATQSVTNIDTTSIKVTLGTATPKTNNITIPFTVTVGSSGVKSTSCVYGTSTSYGSTGTISGSNCVISGLKQGTTYYYKVTASNNAGGSHSATGSGATPIITPPTISVPSTCTTSKTVTITYSGSNITSPVYQYSTDGTNWSTSTSTTKTVTFTSNGKIYARTSDGTNTTNSTSYPANVTNVDVSNPTLTLGTATAKTDSITVPFTAADSDCAGTVTTTCVYGTSTSYGKTGTVSGTNCVMSGLTQGTTYYYKLTTTDAVGKTVTKTGSKATASITTPTISVPTTCTSSKNATITYSGSNITSPVYQYSTDGSTWKTASSTQTVTFTSTGTIYARTLDGSNNVKSTSTNVTNVDTTTPSVSIKKTVSSNKNVLTASVSPTSPACGSYTYEWYKNGSKISGATSSSYTTAEAGTYKIRVISTAGKSSYSNEITIGSCTVSYNANGGSGAPSSQTKIQDLTLTLSSTKPTRTSYTFKGWGTSASDTTVDYAAGASFTSNTCITLYAIWELDYYCATGNLTTDSSGNYICVANNPVLRYTKNDYTRTSYYTNWSCSTNNSASSCSASGSSTCSSCTSYTTCSANPTTYTSWSCGSASTVSSCSASGSSTCSSCTSYTTCSTNPTTYTAWSCGSASTVSSCSPVESSSCSSCTSYTTCSTNPTTYTAWSCGSASTVSSCTASNSSSCSSCTSYTTCSKNATTYTKSTYTRSKTTSGIEWCLSYKYGYSPSGNSNYSPTDTTTYCDGQVSSCTVCSVWTSGSPYETNSCQNCRYDKATGGSCEPKSSGKYICTESGYQCQLKVKNSTITGCYSFETGCHHPASDVSSYHQSGIDYRTCSGTFYGSWSSPSVSTESSCTALNSSSCSSCTSYTTCSTNATTYQKQTCTRSKNATTYQKQTCTRSANATTYVKQTCNRSLEYTSWSLSSSNSGLSTCSNSTDTLAKTECSSYYTCPSNWSTYSGSGSTMKCYKPADK